MFGSVVRAEQPAAPEFPSSISIVVFPVFVTDRDGHAVQGLTREDFEIRDDGKRAEIAGFRDIDAGDPEGVEALRSSPAARRHYDPGASFEITPRLLDGQGQAVAVGRVTLDQALADDDGLRRYVLIFTPNGVPAGP
jgi:hypothetical protein